MDLAEEVDVGRPLPLPRPLILLQHATEEHLTLVSLLHHLQLGGGGGEGGGGGGGGGEGGGGGGEGEGEGGGGRGRGRKRGRWMGHT